MTATLKDKAITINSVMQVCTCERPTMQKVLGHQRKIDVPEEAPQEVVDLIEHCHEVDYESRISAEEFLIKLQECSHTRARC